VITIVLCNGSEDKWQDHRGVRRHFVEIAGERLIDRTVRQFGSRADVVVSGPDLRYKVPGAALYVPLDEPDNLDADILLSTRALWSSLDRTLVVLGDTWFSDAGVDAIVGLGDHRWFYVGREHGSRFSGTDYGEIFALSFWPEHQAELLAVMLEVRRRQRDEGLWRGGLWEHYRILRGIDPLEHRIDGHFLEVDDETEDFDFGPAFETWLLAREGMPA
jgi:hypothetical protein